MRRVFPEIVSAILLCNAGTSAWAEDRFPSRPITVVSPFQPGGTADVIARAVAPALSESLGKPVIVENRPGATGAIGAAHVARAKPDGYTLLIAPTPVLAINQWVNPKLPYNPASDFAPIINAASAPYLLVVHPGVPARDLAELIALAKAKPLSFASAGSGSGQHLCGEQLRLSAGVDLVHVPYKGAAPAQQDLVAGHVPMACDSLSNTLPLVRAGQVRAIALAARTRHPLAPDIPTTGEAGMPGLEFDAWFGFVAPAATPAAVIDRLNVELARALRTPTVATRLQGLGLTIVADTQREFAALIVAESARWRGVVERSGVKAD
ncbi:MAG TPA: tripartite tricarboxylate transporter substrate binding protein [Burkholderiales bacterium]|nr:tripartite tricarboxylate transporter substrate binding protein [Burkholderiales bacterium]